MLVEHYTGDCLDILPTLPAGSGTTGQVAAKHGRRAILIGLNPEYVELQADRTTVQMEFQYAD